MRVYSVNYLASKTHVPYYTVANGLPVSTVFLQLSHQTPNFEKDVNERKIFALIISKNI
jgi:hypothetical protein